jgi:hypothetical protein
MDFAHFIVTQFNLRNFSLPGDGDYEKWVGWTRNRIKLFREFCLPSIAGQSMMSFTWMLYIDIATPPEFDGFIKELEEYPFIRVCRVNGFDGFFRGYMAEISPLVPDSIKWVMTTRIDNDDCLHRNAVKVIQENNVRKHNFLISLTSGYILNTADLTLSHYYYPMSPFITLIEDRTISQDGIYKKGHTQWDELRLFISREIFSSRKRRARFILNKPYWIQLYHGGNVSNSFYRGLPVVTSRDLSEFSIDIRTKPMPLSSVFRYAHYVRWKRYFKSYVVKTLQKK